MAKASIINVWDRFWMLSVLKSIVPINLKRKKRYFEFLCDCGNITQCSLDNVRSWQVKSCWCVLKEKWKKNIEYARLYLDNKTHWLSKTKIYKVYNWIKDRCNNPNNRRWSSYWKRWIKCEWGSFEEFYIDMWESYQKWLEIDRINVNWNYCKSNCRWATALENSRNKQNTIWVDWICLSDYCLKNSLNYKRVHARLMRWYKLEDCLY